MAGTEEYDEEEGAAIAVVEEVGKGEGEDVGFSIDTSTRLRVDALEGFLVKRSSMSRDGCLFSPLRSSAFSALALSASCPQALWCV